MKNESLKELASIFIEKQLDGTMVHLIVSQNDYHDVYIAKQLTKKQIHAKPIQHIVKFPIKVNEKKFKEIAKMLKEVAENLD